MRQRNCTSDGTSPPHGVGCTESFWNENTAYGGTRDKKFSEFRSALRAGDVEKLSSQRKSPKKASHPSLVVVQTPDLIHVHFEGSRFKDSRPEGRDGSHVARLQLDSARRMIIVLTNVIGDC